MSDKTPEGQDPEEGSGGVAASDRSDSGAPVSRDPPEINKGSPEKDPEEWKTGDEPMTGAQASYLETLSREAGEPFEPSLTKAEASRRIDELQEKTGRGKQG
jgi:hypothetical protein